MLAVSYAYGLEFNPLLRACASEIVGHLRRTEEGDRKDKVEQQVRDLNIWLQMQVTENEVELQNLRWKLPSVIC